MEEWTPNQSTAGQQALDLLDGQQHCSGSSSTASPRRRKAPIDIDTALRLQSQASYVQEPARTSSVGSSSRPHACTRIQQQQTIDQRQTASLAESSTLTSGQYPQQNKQAHGSLTSYYDHNYQQQQQHSTNYISVDYIDCLSNNDLVTSPSHSSPTLGLHHSQQPFANSQADQQQPPAAVEASSQTAAMRVHIPSCRKHLSRFHHRAHRVEPSQPTAASSSVGGQSSASSQNINNLAHNSNNNNNNDQSNEQNSAADNSSCSMMTSMGADSSAASFDRHQLEQAQASELNTTSCLYPISVSEAKKRTYFIGSVSQDSLLSPDELYRYFPTGRVSIFVCTWNQNRKRAPSNLNDLLLPDRLVYMPDIYAIGIQEAYSSQQDYLREWEVELQTTLGPNHVLLHSCSLGTLHLALFIRRDLIWFCSTPEESLYNSRSMPTNMIKTKGAVSVAFRFFGTSFMFTNCHFPAHENRVRDRVDEYQRIINSIDLPKNLRALKPRYLSNDSTARFDCVFFMGDLNFRIEQRSFDETIQILDDILQAKEEPSRCYEALTQNDELLKVMETQQAFHGFDEPPIKFPPTYKFLAQTNKYDRQTKRVPSYTDRILYRSKRQRHIQCLIYDWLPQLMSSDHKPVYSLFDVLIRPGHEQNIVSSLNAGLFQRAVYMEALKRRAEDADGIREDGASGNLICSIS